MDAYYIAAHTGDVRLTTTSWIVNNIWGAPPAPPVRPVPRGPGSRGGRRRSRWAVREVRPWIISRTAHKRKKIDSEHFNKLVLSQHPHRFVPYDDKRGTDRHTQRYVGLAPFAPRAKIQQEQSLNYRMAAAAAFGAHREGAPWAILILLKPQVLDDPAHPFTADQAPAVAPFENAITASLIDSIPGGTNSDCTVLWATTMKLSDSGVEADTHQSLKNDPFGITQRQMEMKTRPICGNRQRTHWSNWLSRQIMVL